MNKILYYANFVVVPLLFAVYLVRNVVRSLQQAYSHTMAQMKSDYLSNKRYYKM